MKGGTGAEVETDTHSDAPSLNMGQRAPPTSLRKASRSESEAMSPLKQRLVVPPKLTRIARDVGAPSVCVPPHPIARPARARPRTDVGS